jgi:hypothetical protein
VASPTWRAIDKRIMVWEADQGKKHETLPEKQK